MSVAGLCGTYSRNRNHVILLQDLSRNTLLATDVGI